MTLIILESYQQALYSYPNWYNSGGNPNYTWLQIIQAAKANPQLQFLVAVNPNSGPESGAVNTDYTQGIADLKTCNNIIILGYVFTQFGTRAMSGNPSGGSVVFDVNNWSTYHPNINGIMLDQMAASTGAETFYTNITNYIHTMSGVNYTTVFGNAGTNVAQTYVPTVDIINIWENNVLPSNAQLQNSTFSGIYPKGKFSMGTYNITGIPSAATIQGFANYVGWMNITDNSGTYASNPSYLSGQLAAFTTVQSGLSSYVIDLAPSEIDSEMPGDIN